MYEIYKSAISGSTIIFRIADSAFIPVDEGNADYQQYLVDTDGGLPLPKETK